MQTYFEFKTKDFSEFNPFLGRLSVLPLDFISFTASKQNRAIELKWTTTQEINTKGFAVEWSTDGIYFKSIGSVPSYNMALINNYSFIHNFPSTGANYYRMKQIDMDGKYFLSRIIRVELTDENRIVIAPNPVHDKLTITLPANNNYTNIKVVDINGKLLLQRTLTSFGTVTNIDVHSLTNGMYILEIDGVAKQRIKFLKY